MYREVPVIRIPCSQFSVLAGSFCEMEHADIPECRGCESPAHVPEVRILVLVPGSLTLPMAFPYGIYVLKGFLVISHIDC